jgi:hypothetical protein
LAAAVNCDATPHSTLPNLGEACAIEQIAAHDVSVQSGALSRRKKKLVSAVKKKTRFDLAWGSAPGPTLEPPGIGQPNYP